LNERLIGMGFSHVLDTSLAAALLDAQLLQRIAEGERLGGEIGASLGADYLVLGKVEAQARPINLADGHGGYRQTQLMTGQADMTVRLIRFSTGELVEAFAVEGQGVDNGSSMARRKARQKAALRAAEKLEAKFKKLSAQVEAPCQIIAYTEDYGKVEQLAKELRRTAGVRNVYIREHRQGKAVLEVSLTQRTETLARQLRQRGGELNIYVDDLAEGSLTLVLS